MCLSSSSISSASLWDRRHRHRRRHRRRRRRRRTRTRTRRRWTFSSRHTSSSSSLVAITINFGTSQRRRRRRTRRRKEHRRRRPYARFSQSLFFKGCVFFCCLLFVCARECGTKRVRGRRVKTERKQRADVMCFFFCDGFSGCGGKWIEAQISRELVVHHSKRWKSKKKKKDIHTQNSFLQQSYVIPAAHTKRAQTNVFFLLISHSSPTRPPSVCERERKRFPRHMVN